MSPCSYPNRNIAEERWFVPSVQTTEQHYALLGSHPFKAFFNEKLMEAFLLQSSVLFGATLPVFGIIIAVSIVRQYLDICMNRQPSRHSGSLSDAANKTILFRSKALRLNGKLLSIQQFLARRAYFLNPSSGVLLAQKETPNAFHKFLSSQTDPGQMMTNLKNQACLLFLNGGVGYLISYLFSGYLVAKTPFPLPEKLKLMLQRDINLPHGDSSFLSSVSWYFFVLMCSTQFLNLLLHLWGDDAIFNDNKYLSLKRVGANIYPGMALGGGATMPGAETVDYNKLFAAEIQALDFFTHRDLRGEIINGVLDRMKKIHSKST